MKRIVLIIGVILLGLAARAQSVTYTCRYWFDQNHAQAVTTTFGAAGWEAELDVGNLADGIHALHLNVLASDTESVFGIDGDSLYHATDTAILKWSAPQSYLFLKISDIPAEELTYRYWFDQDFADVQSGGIGSGHLLIDVEALSSGLHSFHLMLKGTDYTAAQNYFFLKTDPATQGGDSFVYHCWFDEDFEHQQSDTLGAGHLLLDVADLEEGMHSVHVLVQGSQLTATQSYLFMKVAPFAADSVDMSHLAYHCWFDQDYENRVTDSLGNGQLLLDVADLEEGLHTVHVMLEGSTLTATQSYMFMKLPVEDVSTELQYICWFDQDYGNVQTGLVGSGLIELEAGDLPNGIHTVNVQLDNGMRTAPQTYLFYKQPLGGYDVARWEYWVNDDFDNRNTTLLSPTIDSLSIVSLLSVGHPALRSSCFHFHPDGDNPYINAKNQITFRIWDSEMRFFDKSAMFVDEQVQQDIVANVFDRNTTETFAAPRDNQIRWFKLDAVVGDSLSFIASKACTMQLFAPSGEEVLNVSGPESITLRGLHAWEDGTYYLAVHDQTGSGETVSVTYNWIEKYCVLAFSRDNVGNRIGNLFTMDLIGNGFNYLENAMLIRELDTIVLSQIVISSRTRPRFQFLINDYVANGKYDFFLTFKDGEESESLMYEQVVELEEPNPGEKLVTITTPKQTANPYPVRVTVENTGNMDYVYVPFNVAFTWPTNSYSSNAYIDQIDFADFSAAMTYEADSVGYTFAHLTPNLLGMNKDGGIMFFGIPYLRAHETRSFTFDFTAPAHIRFDFYAWVGDGYEYNVEFDSLVYQGNRATPLAQNLLDFGDAAEEVGGHLGNPADLAGQTANNSIKTGVAIGGIYNAIGHIQDMAALESAGIDPGDPLYEEIMNLHPPIATPGEILGGWAGEMLDRMMGFQRTCGDLPTPNPGSPCHVFLCHPGDPNEMHGYLSESGSSFIRQEIENVQYQIEFENDTTIASAAAHTIIVRDTLDGSKFDLNSLVTNSVTLGNKTLDINGEQQFAYTLDMRPELYVIAQIEQDYDPATGIIEWTIQSLDPMTMEPTDDPNQGVLPVNYTGNGVGFIDYSVNLKQVFDDGTEISNRAGIIFDQEEVIMTPTWTNIVDAVKPSSHIESAEMVNDSLAFSVVSEDNRSGVWYHSLYYRNDSTAMEWQVKKAQAFGNEFKLRFDDFQTTEYLVMAVDSAGNREEKDMVAEYIYYYEGPGPASQTDNLAAGWNWWSTYVEMNNTNGLEMLQNGLGHNGLTIKSQNDFTDNYYQDMGEDYWYGSLESLRNEDGYLINVLENGEVTLSGSAAIPMLHPITIQPQWNWIGYPVSVPQSVTTALAGFNPSGDDMLKGQDDFASYYEGYGWYPDDFMLVPGQCYLYLSKASESKTLTYAGGSRGWNASKVRKPNNSYWPTNVHAFADNLNVIAIVSIDSLVQRNEHLELGAFVDGECRGSARLRYFAPLDRYYALLTVSGQEGDRIGFQLADTDTYECFGNSLTQITFSKNAVWGSFDKPFEVGFGGVFDGQWSLSLYPNPVERNTTFSLSVPQNEEIVEVVITDVLGTVIRHEIGLQNTKSIKGLPTAGVYLVQAVGKSGITYHGRLIVE